MGFRCVRTPDSLVLAHWTSTGCLANVQNRYGTPTNPASPLASTFFCLPLKQWRSDRFVFLHVRLRFPCLLHVCPLFDDCICPCMCLIVCEYKCLYVFVFKCLIVCEYKFVHMLVCLLVGIFVCTCACFICMNFSRLSQELVFLSFQVNYERVVILFYLFSK